MGFETTKADEEYLQNEAIIKQSLWDLKQNSILGFMRALEYNKAVPMGFETTVKPDFIIINKR